MKADRFTYFLYLFSIIGLARKSSANAICPERCYCGVGGITLKSANCAGQLLKSIPSDIPEDRLEVRIDGNHFSSPVLHRSNISYLTNVQYLFLHNCALEAIDSDAFLDLKKLKFLDLSTNNIKTIEADTFNGLHLDTLDLSYNRGMTLNANAFRGLSVEILNLGGCDFIELDSRIFLPLKSSLDTLLLDFNRLEGLSNDWEYIFTGLNEVSIKRNALRCDCHLTWLKHFYYKNWRSVFKRQRLICQAPPRVKGKEISELFEEDFQCESVVI